MPNNSATYPLLPPVYLPAGQSYTIPGGWTEPDGDVVQCSLVHSLSAYQAPMSFATGLSLANPLNASSFSVNPNTGDITLLANGYQATEYCDDLPITPVRGQTSLARLDTSEFPRYAVDHATYMVRLPGDSQQVVLGASYLRGDTETDLRLDESNACLSELAGYLPALAGHLL